MLMPVLRTSFMEAPRSLWGNRNREVKRLPQAELRLEPGHSSSGAHALITVPCCSRAEPTEISDLEKSINIYRIKHIFY